MPNLEKNLDWNKKRGTEKPNNPKNTLSGKDIVSTVKDVGVLPEPFQTLMTPLKYVFYYAELVLTAIRKSVRQQYDMGYSEGYARVLTYVAFGRDPTLLPFIGYWGGYRIYADKGALEEESRPGHPMIRKGVGFFDGKQDAINDLVRASTKRVEPEDYLNTIFQNIVKTRGVDETIILNTRLPYYTDEDIWRMFGHLLEEKVAP